MLRCRITKAATAASYRSVSAVTTASATNRSENIVRNGNAIRPFHSHDGTNIMTKHILPLQSSSTTSTLTQKRYMGIGRTRPSTRFPSPFEESDDDDDSDFSETEDNFFALREKEEAAAAEEEAAAALEEEERARIQAELDSRTGRLWTDDWALTDEMWSTKTLYDDLPDWDRSLCSRVSKERVKVYDGGIPTLATLSTLPLPSPPPVHPAHNHRRNTKIYGKYRKDYNASQVANTLTSVLNVKTHIDPILLMQTWQEKQIAVDQLYENMYDAVKEKEDILKNHPKFREWVEAAVERHLTAVVEQQQKEGDEESTDSTKENEPVVPVFMELANSTFAGGEPKYKPIEAEIVDIKKANDKVVVVPPILYPLPLSHTEHKDKFGRMSEEWELTADDERRRIMMRSCMSDIASVVEQGCKEEGGKRVFVHGKRGVGKTAALAAIVASARTSGNIVLYLPDGDRLRKLGFYIEPNTHLEGLFDLPVLAKEICSQLLISHEHDMGDIMVSKDDLETFLSKEQRLRFYGEGNEESDVSIVEVLQKGSASNTLSSGCYGAAIHTLMNQTSKPFVVVMDEFNCYYDYGHYFHQAYDEMVYKPIPIEEITLFKPLLEAMSITPPPQPTRKDKNPVHVKKDAVLMKRGAIVVATSESRAVARKFTDELYEVALKDENVSVVEVPRYSKLEVEHILSHFEVVGIGRLRFDRGETVMKEQEVAYLNMLSGGVGQYLLNACII
mmetsp:Transcript_29788/g.43354  ORF Transcript_29788/g.43354 Transcript_29788/m.43354 type:complete len:730 (+) Transcript_29788:27-2216(+)